MGMSVFQVREVYAATLLQNVFDTDDYRQSFKLLRFDDVCIICLALSVFRILRASSRSGARQMN